MIGTSYIDLSLVPKARLQMSINEGGGILNLHLSATWWSKMFFYIYVFGCRLVVFTEEPKIVWRGHSTRRIGRFWVVTGRDEIERT